MPAQNHVHTYVLYKAKSGKTLREKTFRCADPECTHFADAEMVIGKKSRCTQCGSEFILDSEAARRVRPRCLICSDTKKGKAAQAAKLIVGNLLSSLDQDRGIEPPGGFDDD